MSTALLPATCGNCKGRHSTIEEYRICHLPIKACALTQRGLFHPRHVEMDFKCRGFDAPPATVAQRQLEAREAMVTQAQLDYIAKLSGDLTYAAKLTRKAASGYIDRLKREGHRVSDIAANAPNRQQTKIPLDMLLAVPDGYYASRMDATYPYTFFRFSRPKRGNFKGMLKIQTQHGPDLKLALQVRLSDKKLYWSDMSVEDALLLVCVDVNGCAIAYAEELRHCMRCNTELTDERSRWYGIGPECEKVLPHIIDLINDRKGKYVPGWEQREA